MEGKLSFRQYLLVGSLLFGMLFGAGNLIFPVHLGQEAGSVVNLANLGFLVTGVGLPFLGVVAMGLSGCKNLQELAGRVHPLYGKIFTIALYLAIGPAFALPRTGTVSYEIGLAPYLGSGQQGMGLGLFTACFFFLALCFSLKPSKLLLWIGKFLNPLFLFFLGALILAAVFAPMGNPVATAVQVSYSSSPFFKGFTEGYNTMDVLAVLAFAIIIVNTLQDLGLKEPKAIAWGTIKSGVVIVVLMCGLYTALSWMGATSLGKFSLSANGGLALAQIANHYFGALGAVLLALIVTLACLKTAIGLICSCSDTFAAMFPEGPGYRTYVYIFTVIAFLVSNVGLTQIITLAIPVLMFLYPLAITLILLTFVAMLLGVSRPLYAVPTFFTAVAALGDALNVLPQAVQNVGPVEQLLGFYRMLPFFNLGMGWIVPALVGFILSFGFRKK